MLSLHALMLNAHLLEPRFAKALGESWDERAIWPGCKDGFQANTSPSCYGQCLVGTLVTWIAHGGPDKGWSLVPGIAYGQDLPEKGVWHFQLAKSGPDTSSTPVDVTWQQFSKDVSFTAATASHHFHDFSRIMSGSLMEDASLVSRIKIISENLTRHGISLPLAPRAIAAAAQKHFIDQVIQSHRHAAIALYEPGSDDWERIGNKLSDFTDTQKAPAWNPLFIAFRIAAHETGKPVAEAIMTINQGEAELNLLHVDEADRRQGLGRQLVSEFEKIARATGNLSAIIRTPSWQGQGYYEQLGYQQIATWPLHPDAQGRPRNSLVYYKDLRREP